jgi:hypothetical protein
MEVSQGNLAWLWIGALLCGFVFAVLEDLLLRSIRALALPINVCDLSPRRLRMYQFMMPKGVCGNEQLRQRPCRRFFHIGRSMARFIYDILFAIAFAIVLILLLYLMNDGRFRLSAVCIMVIGIVLYRLTFGRVLYQAESVIAILLQGVIARLIQIISFPVRCIWKWTARPRRFFLSRMSAFKQRIRHIRKEHKKRTLERKKKQDDHFLSEENKAIPQRKPDGRYMFVAGGSNRQE